MQGKQTALGQVFGHQSGIKESENAFQGINAEFQVQIII
jgi:hypothetical protein